MIKTVRLTKKNTNFSAEHSEIHPQNYDIAIEIWKPELPVTAVPVYVHFGSRTIKRYIPLRKFSKDFKEMYENKFFKKVFYDDDQVTAQSIHNTFFVPKITTDF